MVFTKLLFRYHFHTRFQETTSRSKKSKANSLFYRNNFILEHFRTSGVSNNKLKKQYKNVFILKVVDFFNY